MNTYILTIKFSHNPEHDPRSKVIGSCPVSNVCTDKTGAHHSVLVEAFTATAVEDLAAREGWHITRIERVTTVRKV